DVPAHFKCPKGSARYKVVRVKTEPSPPTGWCTAKFVKSRSPLWMARISSNTFSQRDRAQFAVETRANCPLFASSYANRRPFIACGTCHLHGVNKQIFGSDEQVPGARAPAPMPRC